MNSTSFEIPVFFSHFHFNAYPEQYHNQTLKSNKINDVNVPFVNMCTFELEPWYNDTCKNLVVFNMTFEPFQSTKLEIEWEYDPKIARGKYLMGYSIFSQGWNKSIEYEEVIFRFHSNVFYKKDQICLYSSEMPFNEYFEKFVDYPYEGCNCTNYSWECIANEDILYELNEISNKTLLNQGDGYKYYQYVDTDISKDHYLVISNPFRKPLSAFDFLLIVIFGLALIVSGSITIKCWKNRKKSKNSGKLHPIN